MATTEKYERLIAAARDGSPAVTIVVHPCDESSPRGAVEAAEAGLIEPVLVGPAARIVAVAAEHGTDIAGREIVDAPHSHAAAARAVALVREGRGELLMKGSLHTDELMRAVTSSATGLRTERRISHAIDPEAARIKGIAGPVAGHAQILVVPDLEAGNMLAKNLTFLAHADAAGIVLGARVPIVLTSRSDSVRTRLASCAVAAIYANARRKTAAGPA